jgi:S-adenosylmethionine synthetase
VEVVERKGLGHPDTICDALAEHISVRLSRHYLEQFGGHLTPQYNADKILLCGGSARPAFRGGEVTEPIEIYLGGRATTVHRGERIPVADLAIESCQAWLRKHLPAVDVERHVKVVPRFRPGSGDLTRLFSKGKDTMLLANDTSCGTGFAPFTPLETVVLAVERALNSPETKRTHPAIGQDIKVMGVRRSSRISLTIGCAMIGRYLRGIGEYTQAKIAAREVALEADRSKTSLEVDAIINAADDLERGDVFLTVTGTSAEGGDNGEVGRGNRTSGLITPYRPMTLEAAAGKNPVTHVGKFYNLAATGIAARITHDVPGVGGASCVLVSQIGRLFDDPQIVDVRLTLESGGHLDALTCAVSEIVNNELHRFPELQAELLAGSVPVY